MTAQEAKENSERFKILNRNAEIVGNLNRIKSVIGHAISQGRRSAVLYDEVVENNTITWLVNNNYTVEDIAEDKYRSYFGDNIQSIETKVVISW